MNNKKSQNPEEEFGKTADESQSKATRISDTGGKLDLENWLAGELEQLEQTYVHFVTPNSTRKYFTR